MFYVPYFNAASCSIINATCQNTRTCTMVQTEHPRILKLVVFEQGIGWNSTYGDCCSKQGFRGRAIKRRQEIYPITGRNGWSRNRLFASFCHWCAFVYKKTKAGND